MLTMVTVKKLDEATQASVEQALIVLARSKVLLMEVESQQLGIMNRFDEEDETQLAKRVATMREQTRVMKGIQQLGEQLMKEKGIR